MKRKLFIQAILISFLFLALTVLIIYWDIISNERTDYSTKMTRRYVDLSSWSNFNHYEETNFLELSWLQFDNIFVKTFYLLVVLQSFLLIKKLQVKNVFLIIGLIISSAFGGCLVILSNRVHHYFVTGLNPYIMYIPVFFLVLQLVIWVYLNMFLFKRLAEKNSE